MNESWESRERLHLNPPDKPPTVEDNITAAIRVLDRMLTEYHDKRPDRPLRRHL